MFGVLWLFGADFVGYGVPPEGRGVFYTVLNLFVSEGGVRHFPSVHLHTGLPLLIFRGFSEFLSWLFQFEAVSSNL